MLKREREEIIRKHCEEEKVHKQTIKLYDKDDKAFLKYADEMIQDCIKKGRYLHPILNTIQVSYQC
jgi:hypothetical protein